MHVGFPGHKKNILKSDSGEGAHGFENALITTESSTLKG